MRIKVKLLEDHGRIFLGHVQVVLFGNRGSGDGDGTRGRILQMVDAPDKGGFTGTGRADDDQLFAFLYRQIDIFQDLKVPEIFFSDVRLLPCQPYHSPSRTAGTTGTPGLSE